MRPERGFKAPVARSFVGSRAQEALKAHENCPGHAAPQDGDGAARALDLVEELTKALPGFGKADGPGLHDIGCTLHTVP
jgi:hypothetical protein